MLSLQTALVALALSGAGDTVLLDFYSDTCRPCLAMAPTISELEAKGFAIRRVNVAREPALAEQFGVRNIPCFVMLIDGREVDRVVGGTTYSRLERMCKAGAARSAKAAAGLAQVPAAKAPPAAPARAGAPSPVAGLGGVAADDRAAAANWTAREGASAGDGTLISATVRLRIEDADGHSCGSGTIIDAREGQALVLTCGHIFRDSKGQGRIEVDLFGSYPAERIPGRLISYDLKRDVGLVAIRTPVPVFPARVAPPGYRIRRGEAVVSVGCNNGNPPTARHSQVTSLDKFLGPPNLQVAGQPVEGRSGGGLFSSEGLVIGVCNAADRSDQEGLFAALASIHSELDQAGLAGIYRGDNRAALVAVAPPAAKSPRPTAGGPAADPRVLPASAEAAPPAGLPESERPAMQAIQQYVRDGAEVVCIVRDCRNPQAKSEVLMLSRASPAFLQQLDQMAAKDAGVERSQHETSLESPRTPPPAAISSSPARKPILEWDASAGWLHREPLPLRSGD